MAGESTNWESPDVTNPMGRRTLWALPWGNYIEAQTYAQPRIFLGSHPKCVAAATTGEPNIGDPSKVCYSGWFSGHPAGMNFITCDGASSALTSTSSCLRRWAASPTKASIDAFAAVRQADAS
jgi:hypothetical protein